MLTARFRLGAQTMTATLRLWMLADGDEHTMSRRVAWLSAIMRRHVIGDWGELDEFDRNENELAVDKELRLLSSYEIPDGVGPAPRDTKVWIITEADRSVTTLLFPSDY